MKTLFVSLRTFAISLIMLLLACPSVGQTEQPIVYQIPSTETDTRHHYPEALLKLILEKSDTQRKTKSIRISAAQDRVLLLLRDKIIDVFWTGSSDFRNEEFTAIRYPIFKGLLGYRLVLLNKNKPNLLENVSSLSQLREFTVGQGGGWPEVRIYSENGFIVQSATTYEGLFNMLSKNRFDLFPRSIIEVWGELESFSEYNITLDQNVLVRYPFAMYFYVRKDDGELKDTLNRGFSAAIDSGEFEALFLKYNSHLIDKANLQNRSVIDLENPLFSDVREDERSLYYDL